MITINTQDCGGIRKGTGVLECFQKLGRPNGFFEVDISWSATLATDTLDLTYFHTEMQKENFVPFTNSTGFENTSEESVFETFTSGIKRKVRDGLIEFKFQFNNGYGWHSNASTHEGFNNKAIVLVWDNGVLGFEETSDGKIKGLRRSYLEVANFINNDGSASSKTMINFQLTDSKAYNRSMALVSESTLGFSIKDLKGVIDYDVDFAQAPATGDTSCRISVLASINNSIFAGALLASDLKISGKTIDTATPDTSGKYYDVVVTTAFATNETHTPKINDGTYDIVVVGESLYTGTGKAVTVVA